MSKLLWYLSLTVLPKDWRLIINLLVMNKLIASLHDLKLEMLYIPISLHHCHTNEANNRPTADQTTTEYGPN